MICLIGPYHQEIASNWLHCFLSLNAQSYTICGHSAPVWQFSEFEPKILWESPQQYWRLYRTLWLWLRNSNAKLVSYRSLTTGLTLRICTYRFGYLFLNHSRLASSNLLWKLFQSSHQPNPTFWLLIFPSIAWFSVAWKRQRQAALLACSSLGSFDAGTLSWRSTPYG